MRNTFAWILWAGFTISLLLSTRNPIYILILTVSQLTLGICIAKNKGQPYWLRGNFRFIFTMAAISALINILFVHNGRTVILTFPENWWLIGGNLTLESLVVGLTNGLIIGALYLTFNILNLALSIKQMTRLIPTALKPIAITVTVALTFFPSVQERAREIKEAQMIRGNPMKRIGDWLPLILPLLVTSLEKSLLLAESMTTRGFHLEQTGLSNQWVLIGMVLGTFSIFSGWLLRLYSYPLLFSIALYVIGGLLFFLGFLHSRKTAASTRYHHEGWSWMDLSASALFALTTIAIFILRTTPAISSLAYSAYPTLQAPSFQWMVLFLSLLPAVPVLFCSHD
jgi:energy-coupling factor transport system permease protein